jgi:dehydrogenase/reductase SDR family protein 9
MALVMEVFVCGLVFLVLSLNIVFFLFEKFRNKKITRRPSETIIVITGCDSGFGEMASRALAKLGYKVVAACLTDDGMKRLKNVVSKEH